MSISNLRIQHRYFFHFITISMIVILSGCQTDKSSTTQKDLTEQLAAGADIETIAEHLIEVRKTVGITRALAIHYPNLEKEEAYQIQMLMLSKLEKQGERLVGWKMGGAGVNDFNPLFGFMLASNEVQSGNTASSAKFVEGGPLIEAEVGFVIKKDLPGPVTTRDELIEAIEGVGGFSELISIRTLDAQGGKDATPAHFIADGLSHGGFIQPQQTFSLEEFDYKNEGARVEINGEIISTGNSKKYSLLDAVLFLANTLPKYGLHLHAGDIVITGSILDAPPANAGDEVEIIFTNFDLLKIKFE